MICKMHDPIVGNLDDQGTFNHDKGQKSAILGALSLLDSFEFSPVDFSLSPGFLCNFVRKSPARFPGGDKKTVTSVAVMVFLVPRRCP